MAPHAAAQELLCTKPPFRKGKLQGHARQGMRGRAHAAGHLRQGICTPLGAVRVLSRLGVLCTPPRGLVHTTRGHACAANSPCACACALAALYTLCTRL